MMKQVKKNQMQAKPKTETAPAMRMFGISRQGGGYIIVSFETDGETVDQSTIQITQPDVLAIILNKLQIMVRQEIK